MKNTCKITLKRLSVWGIIFIDVLFFNLSWAHAKDPHVLTEKPLWEVGLIPGAIRMPHYRGSDEYKIWAMPLPYIIYRGEFLEMDRDGLRGIFYRSPHFETNISGWGNPPMDDDNKAREGMSTPDAVIEVGPSLEWHFDGRKPGRNLYLRWALRSVISVGFPDDTDTGYQGLKSAFNFVCQKEFFRHHHKWHFGLNTGVELGDGKYHRYFYEVKPSEANLSRPVYSPEGGFSAFILSLRLIREINAKISIAGYTRWENMSRAVYRHSPLVKEENNFIFGGALIWTLKHSENTVGSKQ